MVRRRAVQDGHTLRMKILGDSNIGLFCVATEKFCLVPKTVTEKQVSEIEKTLNVPVHTASIGYTNFIGAFAVANKNGIVVSNTIEDDEKKHLEKLLGINVCALDSRFNTVGNLIATNDKGAVISSLFTEKQKKIISDALGVEAYKVTIDETPLAGSGCLTNNNGALLHRDINDKEKETIERVLKVRAMTGSLGFGSPWVGAIAVCNSYGLVTSQLTTIHEIVRADDALGFV
ncbi:MAG: translation initiation factor IF-6 [Candidatus Aenigmarchaeota archaeon]|nr:translation initiation factor IF-6 [Candidatus Aenigmarchaeota archaeon]